LGILGENSNNREVKYFLCAISGAYEIYGAICFNETQTPYSDIVLV
jgi:hypothetical protein